GRTRGLRGQAASGGTMAMPDARPARRSPRRCGNAARDSPRAVHGADHDRHVHCDGVRRSCDYSATPRPRASLVIPDRSSDRPVAGLRPWNPLRPPGARGICHLDRLKTTKGRHMAQELSEGAKAPAFTLPRDGNGKVSLKDFKGRNLVLYFYPKADTPGCTQEAIAFSRLRAAF